MRSIVALYLFIGIALLLFGHFATGECPKRNLDAVNNAVFLLTWPVYLYGDVVTGTMTPEEWLHHQALLASGSAAQASAYSRLALPSSRRRLDEVSVGRMSGHEEIRQKGGGPACAAEAHFAFPPYRFQCLLSQPEFGAGLAACRSRSRPARGRAPARVAHAEPAPSAPLGAWRCAVEARAAWPFAG